MDEAMHPLALLCFGMYGEDLPNQDGAPIRIILPWKYGFKSAKAIVNIRFTDKQPLNTWNISAPVEYGFYANVNPKVDHPRWSQAKERRLGEFLKRPTLMFNGYGSGREPLQWDGFEKRILRHRGQGSGVSKTAATRPALTLTPDRLNSECFATSNPSFSSPASCPLALLAWHGLHSELGANPIESITHTTGDWTLIFLLVTLSVTPLRKLTRQYWLIRFRRMLGLFAFFYGTLHLTTYVWLDKFFDVHEMLKDIAKRKFITAGMTAFALMIPLALTSTKWSIRKLGQALADAASLDLFQRRRRSDPLHLAGQSRFEEALRIRNRLGGTPALSNRRLAGFQN